MALVIAEFFGVIGVDPTPPETMGDLIVWLALIYIGVVLVSLVYPFLTTTHVVTATICRLHPMCKHASKYFPCLRFIPAPVGLVLYHSLHYADEKIEN